MYPQIIAEIFPPNQDPTVSYKKLGVLNPQLADKLFPRDAKSADMSKRLAELSPTLGNHLFDAPQLDQTALREWAGDLVQQLGR